MPKNKPHSGIKKRIKVSGNGKLRREKAGRRHLLEKKSNRVTRRLEGTTDVSKNDAQRVNKLLGR